MAQAKRDANHRTSALGISSVDQTTPLLVKINPTTKGLIVKLSS